MTDTPEEPDTPETPEPEPEPTTDDRSHRPLCDWNLYPESRGDSRPGTDDNGCNLDCLENPDAVAAAWRRFDEP